MTAADMHLAICRLVLKGGHWLPLGLDAELTSVDRHSIDGPVISAQFIADTEGQRIVGWREPSFTVQDVQPDGSLTEPDMALALEAFRADAPANAAGVVAFAGRLFERRRFAEIERIAPHLRQSAAERATVQIMDRLHGRKVVGVSLIINRG